MTLGRFCSPLALIGDHALWMLVPRLKRLSKHRYIQVLRIHNDFGNFGFGSVVFVTKGNV